MMQDLKTLKVVFFKKKNLEVDKKEDITLSSTPAFLHT